MFYKIINQNRSIQENLLPLETLKDHLRVYDSSDDFLIELYRASAFDYAQKYMNRIMGRADLQATFPTYRGMFFLPMGKAVSIQSITAMINGETVEVEGWFFNEVASMILMDNVYINHTNFVISYTVDEEVPSVALVGILKLVAHFYENREEIAMGVSAVEIPTNHKSCFDLYRLPPMD